MNFLKRILKYLLLSIKWRGKCKFGFSTEVAFRSTFEGCNKIYPKTIFSGSMGYGTYIASNAMIVAKVGRFSSIGPNCNVIFGRHPYAEPFVTTSPMFFSLLKQNGDTFATEQMYEEEKWISRQFAIEIESDCWLGYGVNIISGVKIGTGAVVLANALVTKDVPPYAIVGGVPAKIIRYRYDETTIQFLLQSKWWEKDPQWLRQNWRVMTDINEFQTCFSKMNNISIND